MAQCDILPLGAKACSGKCRGSACGAAPRIWVVAACEGMIVVFEKHGDAYTPKVRPGTSAVGSLEGFKQTLERASATHDFDQMVVVGSPGDIAWVHSSLPEDTARHVAAEITYPLLSGWFREPNVSALAKAVNQVVAE